MLSEIDEAQWLGSLFPDDLPEEKRLVTLFVGYFDDSGRKDGNFPTAVVGGFVAHPTEWLGFNHKWKKILDRYGIEVHHQNKWSNHAKPFHDQNLWPDERRYAYLNELVDLITSVDAVTIGAAVPIERFDTNFPGGRNYISPFGYAAECVFGRTAEVVKALIPDARIAYVFESGTQGFGEVRRIFNESLSNPKVKEEFGLISLAEGDKRDFMQLQAADIMAYEVFKLYEKGDTRELSNPRYPLRRIGDRLRGSWMTPSDEMLKKSAALAATERAISKLLAGLSK